MVLIFITNHQHCWTVDVYTFGKATVPTMVSFGSHLIKLQIILCLHIPVIHSRIYYLWEKRFVDFPICSEPTEAIHQAQNDYLRKVLRSPACVMATSVLVTEVPMLVPMMMGTASWTVSTARAHTWFPSTSVLPGLHRDYVWRMILTFWRDHADNYGGGSGWALDQQGDQNTDDQTSQRVGQHRIVLKDVTCCFTWICCT